MIVTIGADNLETELKNSKFPVLIRFGSPSCIPCKQFNSLLIQLSEKLKENIKFCGCNIDENPELAKEFCIKTVPTFILMQNGQIIDSRFGIPTSLNELESWIINKLQK